MNLVRIFEQQVHSPYLLDIYVELRCLEEFGGAYTARALKDIPLLPQDGAAQIAPKMPGLKIQTISLRWSAGL